MTKIGANMQAAALPSLCGPAMPCCPNHCCIPPLGHRRTVLPLPTSPYAPPSPCSTFPRHPRQPRDTTPPCVCPNAAAHPSLPPQLPYTTVVSCPHATIVCCPCTIAASCPLLPRGATNADYCRRPPNAIEGNH